MMPTAKTMKRGPDPPPLDTSLLNLLDFMTSLQKLPSERKIIQFRLNLVNKYSLGDVT